LHDDNLVGRSGEAAVDKSGGRAVKLQSGGQAVGPPPYPTAVSAARNRTDNE